MASFRLKSKANGKVKDATGEENGNEVASHSHSSSPFHKKYSLTIFENRPRRHSWTCPEEVTEADDLHLVAHKPTTSAGYCVSCPICKGNGCDWSRDNESCGSVSISSLDSYDGSDDDDSDDCSSITITDSEDNEGMRGRYDLIELKSIRAVAGDRKGFYPSYREYAEVDDDEEEMLSRGDEDDEEDEEEEDVSLDVTDQSMVEDGLLEEATETVMMRSPKTSSLTRGHSLNNDIIRTKNTEARKPTDTAIKENQGKAFGVVNFPENSGTAVPFEIIQTDENGEIQDKIVLHLPSGNHNSDDSTAGWRSDTANGGIDNEISLSSGHSNEKAVRPTTLFDSSWHGLQDLPDSKQASALLRPSENEGPRTQLKDEVVGSMTKGNVKYLRSESCGVLDSGRHFVDKGNILVRKSAVRRKGFAWRSKTFPKNSKSTAKTEEIARKSTSLPQTGSSLELAPSLLNLYDDKAASGADSSSDLNGLLQRHDAKYENDEDDTAPFPLYTASQSSAHQHSTPASNSRVPSAPSSSSIVSTSSNIVFRSGKLPSLSQPLDRPVSLMETDSASITKRNMDPTDSKKRPLSLGSMSSVSTSSLSRARKKRASANSRLGNGHASRTGEETIKDHRSLPSELVSESYSSMDSGCVEGDRNGERYYDDMSVTSSSEGASVRGDTAAAFTVGGGTSSSSLGIDASPSVAALDRSDSSLSSSSKVFNSSANSSPAISKKASGISEQFNNRLSPDVIYPPSALKDTTSNLTKQDSSFDEDSYVIRKMGSYINRNSAALPTEFSGKFASDSADQTSELSTPEQERKRSASSRNQARERFYSNYEEHYNKYVSSPVDSESSFEMLSDLGAVDQNKKAVAAELASSPGTPSSATPPFPLILNTQSSQDYHQDISPTVEISAESFGERSKGEGAEKIQSPTSPRSPSSKHFDARGSSSQGPPSSPHRSSSSRSSRRRESPQEQQPAYVSYVQRVVMEIVDSERTYLTSLEDIIYGYLEPLEHMLNMDAAKDDIMCLFSNIRDIYNFNRCFLADLEETDSDPIKVAECFVRHNRGFVIYTEYCTNYPSAVEVLTRFMKHPELSELCKQRQMALGHGLPLGAYLLRPVQRILKYHLLLQNIVKNYEKEKRDVPVLKQAFQHMTQMAHHINEMKRKHEHAVRIQEIQSQLEDYVGEDLTRLGDLVLESTFQVYGAKASRQVFLFERGLLISKKKEGGMLSCKTFIKCSNLMLVEVIPNEPLSFHAIPFDNPRAQYTFQARNMEQKRRWCQEIKRLILESFKGRIPDNVKNLVMELGRDHDDDFVSKEAQEAVRKHQHTAPEYLEKRRVRRKSGSRMPDFLLRPQKAKRNGQRKTDKPADSRRTESKSPDLQRKAIAKLIFPQHLSDSSSLPNTPVSELNHQSLHKQSSDPSNSPAGGSLLMAQNSNTSLLSRDAPKITSSVSSSDISESSLQNVADKEKRSGDVELVRRASSFRTAIRANPVVSVDRSDRFAVKGDEKDKSVPKVKKGKRRFELKKLSRSDMGDKAHSKSERISEDEGSSDDIGHDDYVLIDENIPMPLGDRNRLGEPRSDKGANDSSKSCGRMGNQGKMPSRSSSLPALVHAVNNSGDSGQSQTDFQSSENVCRNAKVKGRMSRKDQQESTKLNVSGRYKKKHASKCDDTEKDYVGLIPQSKEVLLKTDVNSEENKHVPAFHDSFARHAAEKNAIHKAGLSASNTYNDFGSQDLRPYAYSKGVKAKLTNWNSVDKLTKGSMNDLSHLHENPWELNSKTSRATSLLSFENGAPPSRLERSGTLPSGNLHEKNNLDWLVYLKRNSLLSSPGNNVSSNSKPYRKSTSVLEQGFQGKEILDLKKRISAQSPYATPPRYLMTPENMKRFGSSKFPDKTVHHNDHMKQLHRKSPLASSEMSIPTADPFLSRQSSSHPINASVNKRANPAPAHRHGKSSSLDIDKLTDESNKMVAEMEDYISRTSSCESIKSPNKFPTVLPTISLEEKENEAVNNKNNRFSIVSSISTSSYESQASSSSDGLAGTLKSKLHNWASNIGKRSETYENIYQSPVLSDEEDDSKETVESSSSPPKSKNTFVPPHPHRKVIENQRGLETVLREHSLGSASLGSRMAHSVPIPISPKVEDKALPPLDDTDHAMCKKEVTNGGSVSTMPAVQIVKFNEKLSPEQSRYSLPATKEAVEALMPPALGDCDIQQSDSGFSIHSNSSNVSDSTSPINPPPSPHELMEATSAEVTSSSPTKPVTSHSPEMKQDGSLQRHNSYESIDSTDSFYERRLSLALSSDGFELSASIVPIYDDTMPQGQVDVPQRKSIKEYVQQIEERCKPMAPKICEVRRRSPGFMIQQKLQSLKENAVHGRHKRGGSKDGSEEREFVRANSQPPSQHRRQMTLHSNTTHSIDDININTKYNTTQPKLSPSRSKENLYSPRSKELSRSRDYINLSPSKENLTNIDGKLTLPRMSTRNAYHAHAPGHERDWNSYQLEANEDCSDIDIKGQFVHKVKHESSPLLSKKGRLLSSSEEDEGVLDDRPEHREDQLSSEVDNLVIMKGWVKALITKFQNK